MTRPMHVLLIAPSAPPKNSPEAMQVGRFLEALDPAVRVTLVTTPIVAGWQREDSSLVIDRPRMNVIVPSLPFHRVTQRIVANRRLSFLHRPDGDFWLSSYADYVLRNLPDMPDVIYSRSAPFSAAMLARRIKLKTGLPWLMHLSDPWSGSPYRKLTNQQAVVDRKQEAACFDHADMISLTTEGQANYYRMRYPERVEHVTVTPNMMQRIHSRPTISRQPGPLRIVYTGALYGDRTPVTLLSALRFLYDSAPDIASKLRVDFYGNMTSEIAVQIEKTPGCAVHGPISFSAASQKQDQADLLVTIEPSGEHPLLLHFMPSKNLDYIARAKPILAITPKGSETYRLCELGHGWAFDPSDVTALGRKLEELAHLAGEGRPIHQHTDGNAKRYCSKVVTTDIVERLLMLSKAGRAKGNVK